MPTKPVTLAELVVVDFQKSSETPELNNWKSQKLGSQVFCAEKCARNIWFGAAEDFATFPKLLENSQNEVLTGQDAYERMLHFVLGVRNEGEYDPAAFNRFIDGWEKLNRRNATAAGHLSCVVNKLITDMNVVNASIDREPQSTRTWLIAKELAGQKRGDEALIVGNLDRSSVGASFLTARMATTLNAGGFDKVGILDVTHPADLPSAFQLCTGVNDLYRSKGIRLNARTIDMADELPLAVEMADQVYVTVDMDEFPHQEEVLLNAWMNRTRTDNKLVHVKASERSVALWSEANPKGYISPLDIEREMQAREESNNGVYEKMRLMAHRCAARNMSRIPYVWTQPEVKI